MIKTSPSSVDAAAVALSLGCMVHCLLLPVAAGLSPLLQFEDAEWIHWTFVALAIPISVVALRRTSGARPALVAALRVSAAVGVALLLIGAAGWPDHDWETPLTIAGALVLAATHVVNGLARHTHRHAS